MKDTKGEFRIFLQYSLDNSRILASAIGHDLSDSKSHLVRLSEFSYQNLTIIRT